MGGRSEGRGHGTALEGEDRGSRSGAGSGEARGFKARRESAGVFEGEDSNAGWRRGRGPSAGAGPSAPGGRRPQGAGRRDLPAPPPNTPPAQGSCADRGRRCLLVFPEGSASVSASSAANVGKREPGSKGRARTRVPDVQPGAAA